MGQEKLIPVAPSRWGGTGVTFVVEKNSTSIEYDCAVGQISTQLEVDRHGNFAVDGSHTRLYPGARRVKLQPAAQPARYAGKITGKTIRYKVTLKGTGEVVGEFTAELGEEGRVRSCR